jgi:hypothetical protein
MGINQIIEGTINNLLGKKEDLFELRISICKKCKLYTDNGIMPSLCNPYLYLNPNTNETSKTPKPGFYKGCGCVLGSKTRVKEEKCPAKKW